MFGPLTLQGFGRCRRNHDDIGPALQPVECFPGFRELRQVVHDFGHRLINALAPGGFLVVGPSEGIYDMLSPLIRLDTFLYRKPSGDGP